MAFGAEKTTDLIEYLRGKMVARAEESGNLFDEQVVVISQRLDQYLVQVQHMNRDRRDHVHLSKLSAADQLDMQPPSENWSPSGYRRLRLYRTNSESMI